MTEILQPDSLKDVPKEEGVVRVLVGIAHEGMTQSEAYCNRLWMFKHMGHLEERGKILKESPRFEFYHTTVGRCLTPFAREEMAKRAEASNMDYLFMIDDDMICPEDLFEQLYKNNVDIVAPLAFTRGYPHKPVMYQSIEGWDPVVQKEYFMNSPIMNYSKDKLVECDAVGFGAVLIKIDVIRKVGKPRCMSTCGTGEDIYFCYQAKKLGYRVFMDTRVKLGHLGHPAIITEEYVESVRKRDNMEIEKRMGLYNKYDAKEPVCVLGE